MLLLHKVALSPIGDTEHQTNYIDTTVRGVIVQYNGESVLCHCLSMVTMLDFMYYICGYGKPNYNHYIFSQLPPGIEPKLNFQNIIYIFSYF